MKKWIKLFLHGVCVFFVLPCAVTCWLEAWLAKGAEHVFTFWTHCFALLPGLPGMFLRRAFYCLVLENCSRHSSIGFGVLFSHRSVVVGEHVYLGPYSIIGSARIGKETFVGSRVSILSGKKQHARDHKGQWSSADLSRFEQVDIATHVWIGEGALLMADVASGSLVAAGAVVTSPVARNSLVAGNPAKLVRQFTDETGCESGNVCAE